MNTLKYIRNGWCYKTRRWVRWIAYPVVVIAMFYVIEDTRGWLALRKAKTDYLQSGRILDLNEILGPKPPNEENFAKVDFVAELHAAKGNANPFPNLKTLEQKWFPETGITKIAGVSVSAEEPRFFVKKGRFENDKRALGEALLSRLDPQSDALEAISDALKLEFCQFDDSPSLFSGPGFHFPLMNSALKLFHMRMRANVLAGNLDEAVRNFQNCDAISRIMMENEKVVGGSIGVAFRSMNLDLIWFTLNEQNLGDEHLGKLETILQDRETAVTEILESVQLETAIFNIEFQKLNQNRNEAKTMYDQFALIDMGMRILPKEKWLEPLESISRAIAVYLSPRGWWWQNHAAILREQTGVVPPDSGAVSPYNFLVLDTFGGFSGVSEKAELIDRRTQLVIIAIYLERQKLNHGSYPSDLSGFNVANIASEKFGYQLGRNGRPIIYFDESGTRETPISEAEFDNWNHEYLWRYP